MRKRPHSGRRGTPAGGGAEPPHSLIHRNKGSNPVSMRVAGQFACLEDACNAAFAEANEGPFDPDKFQIFSDPIPALMWASATLLGRGILVGVFPVPVEVQEALGMPGCSLGEGWAVGLPSTVFNAFHEIATGEGGASDDGSRH